MKMYFVVILVVFILCPNLFANPILDSFIQDVINESDGFSFGEAWKYDANSLVAVVPIVRRGSAARKYMLLKEAEKIKISDSGIIDNLHIENGEELPLYIRIGELFAGKTQERTAIRSVIIPVEEGVSVGVRCVNRSKGIVPNSPMTFGGFAPMVLDGVLCSGVDSVVSQRDVWTTVSDVGISTAAPDTNVHVVDVPNGGGIPDYSFSVTDSNNLDLVSEWQVLSAPSNNDDLKKTLDTLGTVLEDVIASVPLFADQVGIVLLDMDGVVAIEIYDSSESWAAIGRDILKKDAVTIAKKQRETIFDIVGVRQAVAIDCTKKVLSAEYTETKVYSTKQYTVLKLITDRYVGEVTMLGDTVIHLFVVRIAE